MTPVELILQAWASAIQTALPDVTRCYFSEIDRRIGSDEDDLSSTGNDAPTLPYIELLSFDSRTEPLGMTSSMDIETPRIVVTGSWPRTSSDQDRTIDVHAISRISYQVRQAIDACMLAHNRREATISGVGMTTRIVWNTRNRPALDGQSDVDEFALEAAFSHFPIAEA